MYLYMTSFGLFDQPMTKRHLALRYIMMQKGTYQHASLCKATLQSKLCRGDGRRWGRIRQRWQRGAPGGWSLSRRVQLQPFHQASRSSVLAFVWLLKSIVDACVPSYYSRVLIPHLEEHFRTDVRIGAQLERMQQSKHIPSKVYQKGEQHATFSRQVMRNTIKYLSPHSPQCDKILTPHLWAVSSFIIFLTCHLKSILFWRFGFEWVFWESIRPWTRFRRIFCRIGKLPMISPLGSPPEMYWQCRRRIPARPKCNTHLHGYAVSILWFRTVRFIREAHPAEEGEKA